MQIVPKGILKNSKKPFKKENSLEGIYIGMEKRKIR